MFTVTTNGTRAKHFLSVRPKTQHRGKEKEENKKSQLQSFALGADAINRHKELEWEKSLLSNLMICVNFIDHLKPRRVEFLYYVFKKLNYN